MASFSQERLSQYFSTAARIAFAVTVFLIPFRWRLEIWDRPFYPLYSDYTNFLLFASDIAMVYTLVFWAGSLIIFPRKLKLGSMFIFISLAGLTLAGWISVLGSADGILSRYQAVRFFMLLLFYLFIVNEIKSVKWVTMPVGAQVLFQSVVVILQVASQSSLGLSALGELTLDPAETGTSVIITDGIRFLRGYGLSDHPNILGGCIIFGLILLLASILYGNTRTRIISSIVFLPCFLALVMTFSRSAWLGFFMAGSFMVGVEAFARRWRPVKVAILLGVLSLLIASPFIKKNISLFQTRVNSGNVAQDNQMQERAFLLDAGNTIFVEHSAIGVGLGVAPLAMRDRFENFPLNFQPPHYAILVVAMETGVLGGIFYLLLLVIPLVSFASNWKSFSQKPVMLGAFALLLAITVVGFFDYYTWSYAYGRAWQWLGWGLYSAALETAV
ncbi:MAG: O-antigen ligase family protein [Anaerolineales bacterium]|nr:O-antigen ligase family protein [Anaerolineales bacterium]